ncbi:MAG TPA: patatin-like phospholipase family protein [Streptosporangiaceae bacterium]|nr:patatin-like phospholipase family protein [Streptosporangiaceae bacterium]
MGPRRQVPPPRVGVVLGAGGYLGAAWMTGALPALQDHLPCRLADVDVMLGTSAGSVLAAALRCRASIPDLIAFQRGKPLGVLRESGVTDVEVGPWPPPPQLRVGSPRLMLTSVLTPRRVRPWIGASAWLPRGRGSHAALREMVQAVHTRAHRVTVSTGPVPYWVNGGQTWIVAVDYATGRRVVFGGRGAPRARIADAVVASCSIPGWYEPAVISGRTYIDGGIRSATSMELLAESALDEVYVLAPMASIVSDHPRKPHERLERRLRQLITQSLLREADSLRALGTRVTLLTPGPEDLAAMGLNVMDPRRRTAVLETSLRTSPPAMAAASDDAERAEASRITELGVA